MKKLFFALLFVSMFSCVSKVGNSGNTVETDVCIYMSEVGNFKFKALIGSDFNSALDSLMKLRFPSPDSSYVAYPKELDIKHVVANNCHISDSGWLCVQRYDAGDRRFFAITFKRGNLGDSLPATDVLDSKGCWYTIEP